MQSINLLKGLPTKQVSTIPFQLFNLILVGWLGFWILISFIMSLIHYAFEYQHKSWIKKRDETSVQIQEVANNKSRPTQEGAVSEALSKLEARIREKEQILYFLETKKTEEFSSYLEMLSSLSQNDLWLTEIKIEPSKGFFDLTGLSTQPQAPLVYAKELDKNPLLKKYDLTVNGIVKNDSNFFQFNISSVPKVLMPTSVTTDQRGTDQTTITAGST